MATLQTNSGTKSDLKEVIKKQLENAPKRIGREKTQMMQMIGLKRPMLIKIWNCIMGIIFLRLNIRSSLTHSQLGSSTQKFKVLAFDAISFTFFRQKVIFEVIVEVSRVYVRKSNNCTTFKERQKFC